MECAAMDPSTSDLPVDGTSGNEQRIELDPESVEKLNEVESHISHIISCGIKDTSLLGNAPDCSSVWAHIQRQHASLDPSDQPNDVWKTLGIDNRIVSAIRAFGEGSTLNLGALVAKLAVAIDAFCDSTLISTDRSSVDSKIASLLPIILLRKNLGEPFQQGSVNRYDCLRAECFWVWESPTLDCFPSNLLENVKTAREIRNLVSRKFKALVKFKEAIKAGDVNARLTLSETIAGISRRIQQESSKKDKVEKKRTLPKDKTSPPGANLLMNWLKTSKEAKPEAESCEFDLGDLTHEQRSRLADILKELPSKWSCGGGAKIVIPTNPSTPDECRRALLGSRPSGGLEAFIEKCALVRDAWTRYHNFVRREQRFFVEGTICAPEQLPNLVGQVEQVGQGEQIIQPVEQSSAHWVNPKQQTSNQQSNRQLVQRLPPRVFQMWDTDWKRPPMHLLVVSRPFKIDGLNQLTIDDSIDYYNDSDEDWFLQYDVDDVDLSESEEESDQEEPEDWIVPDETEQAPLASDNVKVYCLYKNWHWIVDGKPLSSEATTSCQVAEENGIKLKRSNYGFGFENYTRNPIPELAKGLYGNNKALSRQDLELLLKICHGRHTRKEDLIASFKDQRPFAPMADVRNKFQKYIQRVKIDDTPARWMVDKEIGKSLGIQRQLDAILNQLLVEGILGRE